MQKRPTIEAKEAYYRGKRDLLQRQKREKERRTWAKAAALQNVFSYHRMCSLTKECVLLPKIVFSFQRMCSVTAECVPLTHTNRFLRN